MVSHSKPGKNCSHGSCHFQSGKTTAEAMHSRYVIKKNKLVLQPTASMLRSANGWCCGADAKARLDVETVIVSSPWLLRDHTAANIRATRVRYTSARNFWNAKASSHWKLKSKMNYSPSEPCFDSDIEGHSSTFTQAAQSWSIPLFGHARSYSKTIRLSGTRMSDRLSP